MAAPEDVLARLLRERSAQPLGVDVDEARPSWSHAVTALSAFWVGDFTGCLAAAERAEQAAGDDLDQVLAIGALGLAGAGVLEVTSRVDWSRAQRLAQQRADDDRRWSFARYLVAEAALDGARLDVAASLLDGADWASAWVGHPFEVMMRATAIRIAAFVGRIDEALAEFEGLATAAERHDALPLMHAVRVLLTGNADRAAETQQQIDALVGAAIAPVDYVGRGVYLLASFGAVSLGDVGQSAALFLRAGAGADLDRLTIIDRAIGLELLAHAAIAAGDLDAAHAWREQAMPLVEHPISGPACHRLLSRIALAEGDAPAAVEHAERAVEAARREGRGIEAAEGTILLARARIASDEVAEASRTLRQGVAESDQTGHLAMRRSAGRVLRSAGRRLPPPSSGGWSVLSPREREIAELVLSGLEHTAIARRLVLSPQTVRVHVSRVLCAFGVSSRIGLLATLGPRGDTGRQPPGVLTPRQRAVVELVAQGYDNAAIAASLGVSVKAVEKHVGEALRRWQAASRFDLARLWWLSAFPQGAAPAGGAEGVGGPA